MISSRAKEARLRSLPCCVYGESLWRMCTDGDGIRSRPRFMWSRHSTLGGRRSQRVQWIGPGRYSLRGYPVFNSTSVIIGFSGLHSLMNRGNRSPILSPRNVFAPWESLRLCHRRDSMHYLDMDPGAQGHALGTNFDSTMDSRSSGSRQHFGRGQVLAIHRNGRGG